MLRLAQASFCIFILFSSSYSYAGFVFSPTVSYSTENVDDNGTSTSMKRSDVDLRIGYTFDFGLYIGGLYNLGDREFTSDGTSDFMAGPTVGLSTGSLYLLMTYMLVGERDLGSGGIKYTGASGLQIDLGYVVPVSKTFSLGPQLTYKNMKYKDAELSGIGTSADYAWDRVTPYFALWLHF